MPSVGTGVPDGPHRSHNGRRIAAPTKMRQQAQIMAKPIHGHRPIHAAGNSFASPTAGRGRPALQDPPKTPRRGRCPYRPGRRSHWTVGDAGPYGGLPHIHRRDVLKAVPYDDHAPTGANHGEANSWSSTNSCRRQIIRIPHGGTS